LERERPDVAGPLQRNAWEIATFGLYVLLGGPDALGHVAGDHTRNVSTLIERNRVTDLQAVIAGWPVPTRLQMEDVARKLKQLLQAAGEAAADVSGAYDLLYRAESTFGGHGFVVMVPYVDASARPRRIIARPGPITVPHGAVFLGLTGMYTGSLEHHLSRTFGVATTRVGADCRAVHAAMNP